jgi:2-desacetyl-2-hydroxyethyl bacteriochlorophyllide A dehydrogenase
MQVAVQEEDIPPLLPGQALVQTLLSAISSGTEMLIYRGQFPQDLDIDENIAALTGKFHYPLKYGYSTVGQVIDIGSGVEPSLLGQKFFSLHPHESCFAAAIEDLLLLPQDISIEDAIFLPYMETALNLVMDGKPMVGEQVVVCGQGIIGLLTTALLAQFPLAGLVTLDNYPLRRQVSRQSGATACLDPSSDDFDQEIKASQSNGADMVFELSGSPAALDLAIRLTGFDGRVIIGSWYGQKRASLDLGGRFHRSRIRLLSSQVSTLASELSGRWTKERRFQLAWDMLHKVHPSGWITQRFAFHQAAQAYQFIDQHPGETIQVVLTYL